jgi:hypothetical protein
MRLTGSLILAMAVGVLATGCAHRAGSTWGEISRIREAERAIKPFTPTAFHDSTQRHLAFAFRIVGDSLQLVPGPISLRPGRMPYHPGRVGGFLVTFWDSAGRRLGGYGMEDPRTVRSCDPTKGGPGGVILRSGGLVDILAPADRNLAALSVSSASGWGQRFELSDSSRSWLRFRIVVPQLRVHDPDQR